MTLVLHAAFSEGEGATTVNEQDGTHEGVLEGSTSPTWQTSGGVGGKGNHLSFNGVEGGSIVRFPEKAETKISGAISVGAWVKTEQTFPGEPADEPQKEIVTRGGGNFSLGWEEDAVEYFVWLRCYFRASDSDYFELEWRDDNPQPGFRDGDWHHILIRFTPSSDQSTEDGTAQLWVDGVMKDEESHSLADLKVSGVEDWWIVGGRKSTSTDVIDRNLAASIDEVKIWDEYVSDATIASESTEEEEEAASGGGIHISVGNCRIEMG